MISAALSLSSRFKNVARQGIVYGLGAISGKLSAILLLPLYTHALKPADYGILALTSVTAQVAGILFGLGLTSGMFRSYHDHVSYDSKRLIVSTTFLVTVVCSLGLMVTGFLAARFLALTLLENEDFWPYITIAFTSVSLGLLGQIAFTIFRLQEKAGAYCITNLLSFFLEIICIVYLVVFSGWGVMGVLTGRLLAAVATTLVLMCLLRPFLLFRVLKSEVVKMMSYGVPLVFAGLAGFIFTYSDRYLLRYFLNLDQVGIYTLACQFGVFMNMLLITPTKLVWGTAFLSAAGTSYFEEFCAKTLTYVLLFSSLLFLMLTVFAKDIVQLIAPSDYLSAYHLVPLITFAYLAWSTRPVVEVGISLARRTTVTAYYFTLGAIINVTLNLLLIPVYGALGAALATLTAFCSMVVVNFIYNQKLHYIPYEWWRIGKIALATACVLGVSSFVQASDMLLSIVMKVVILSFFPIVLWFLRFFSPQERKYLQHLMACIKLPSSPSQRT